MQSRRRKGVDGKRSCQTKIEARLISRQPDRVRNRVRDLELRINWASDPKCCRPQAPNKTSALLRMRTQREVPRAPIQNGPKPDVSFRGFTGLFRINM